MKRLCRWMSAVLAALSLALCVAAMVLWWRSEQVVDGQEDRISRYVDERAGRYTIRSYRGRVSLHRPPIAPMSPDQPNRRSADELIGAIRNDQLRWVDGDHGSELLDAAFGSPFDPVDDVFVAFSRRDPSKRTHSASELTVPLLQALEDPDRFAIAHTLLRHLYYRDRDSRTEKQADGSLLQIDDGMTARLKDPEWVVLRRSGMYMRPGEVDADQLQSLCEQWHRRLDRRAGWMPHWLLVLVTAIPALGLGYARRRVRCRRDARSGWTPAWLGLTTMAILSLSVAAAAAVLWARSFGRLAGSEDRPSVHLPWPGRYAVSSLNGRLLLEAPPPSVGPVPPDPAPPLPAGYVDPGSFYNEDPCGRTGVTHLSPDATPQTAVEGLRNDQVIWEVKQAVAVASGHRTAWRVYYSPRGHAATRLQSLCPIGLTYAFDPDPNPARHRPYELSALARPLLEALDDPDRWIAAHVLLGLLSYTWSMQERFDGEQGWAVYDGLEAELRRTGYWYADQDSPSNAFYFEIWRCDATIDVAQQAAIREQWHRRLAVPIASVPHWTVVGATMVLPLVWTGLAVVRRRRSRRRRLAGHCRQCGYDLRATPERCPECGAIAASLDGA